MTSPRARMHRRERLIAKNSMKKRERERKKRVKTRRKTETDKHTHAHTQKPQGMR